MTKLLIRILIVLILGTVVAGGYYVWKQFPQEQTEIALAEVKRGNLVVKAHLRGELRAVRSLTLTAPNIGTQSQITQLAPTGALATHGDLIFELDDSERVAALEDSLLSVEQIEEDLKQAEAELAIRKSQDEVEIVQANFQVRRAELEVRRNELLAAIDARKNELTLEEARRRKQKLEEDIKNRLQQREAELAVLREQLNKAQLDVQRDRRRIQQSRVLAPLTGLVSILSNRSAGRGGFGQSLPEIREGDQVPAGMAVAQLLDLSEMELLTRVEESERANLREGQEVMIRLDALPDKTVPGTIKRLGNTASANIFSGEATKKFECITAIDMRQLLLHIGAEPEGLARIMATARQNAALGYGKQASQGSGASSGGRQGGSREAADRQQGRGQRGEGRQEGGQSGSRRGQRAGQQDGQGAPSQARRSGGFDPSRILSRLPADARKKAEALLRDRSPRELSDEERQQFRQIMQAAFSGGGFGGAPGGAGRAGFGSGRGGAGPGLGGGRGGAAAIPAFGSNASGSEFSDAERAAATLPLPPKQGSDLEVMLRPGLLADAEVIVESIPDALYIPYQAVFEEGAQTIVYVLEGSRLQARRVSLGRRSESQVAVLDGLDEGERVSLYRPDSAPASRSKTPQPSSGPSYPGSGAGNRGG